jgi:hypothetical protein
MGPYSIIPRVCLTFVIGTVSVSAQWLNYPTPGIPRTPDGKPNLAAPVPKAPNGKPDLSGLWQRLPNPRQRVTVLGMGPNLEDFMRPGEKIPPLLPAAEALHQQRIANLLVDRPSAHCLPHSIPDEMLIPIPLKIVQNPGVTFILYEQFTRFRQIFTDGRPLPPPSNPSWLGYSIGKWDGDGFVVDTRGFNDKSWLDDTGLPHTEALHTIERFQRRDFGHMDVEITIDDPQSYTKQWSFPLHYQFFADTELMEDVCDNERDLPHTVGK